MTAASVVDDVKKRLVTNSGRIELVTTASVEECPRSKAEDEEATFPPGRALDCTRTKILDSNLFSS